MVGSICVRNFHELLKRDFDVKNFHAFAETQFVTPYESENEIRTRKLQSPCRAMQSSGINLKLITGLDYS